MHIKAIMISLIIFMISFSCQSVNSQDFESISAKELKQKIENKEGIVLLDVRTKAEFNGSLGHIDSAILIPLQVLEASIDSLKEYKDKEIVVYCRSGNRSQTGTRILLKHGYKAVNMLGGMKAWRKLD
jgi:rhodanese-related sulfurtransferase